MTAENLRGPQRRRSAFTLIELLVVIGIIVVLIAILLPVVNSVRKAANVTATKNQMSTIASACQAYYGDYHSYPGPFSEDQIDTNSAATWTLGTSGIPLTGAATANITSTENLVLGLSGGLTVTFANTGLASGFQYLPGNVNSGPQVLNTLIAAQKQTTAYYTPTPAELAPSDGAGGYQLFNTGSATDSVIPEYYDHIPGGIITTNATPNANDQYGPILYMRARVSATGLINEPGVTYSPVSTPPLPAPVAQGQPATGFQYNVYQLAPYGFLWNSISTTDFAAYPPSTTPPNYNPPQGTTVLYDSVTVYFANQAIAGHPKGKDAFILISAGTDRIFGTKDDIIYGN